MYAYRHDPNVIEFPEWEAPDPAAEHLELLKREEAWETEELELACGVLLETDDVLAEVDRDLEGRYAGPTHPVKLMVLALTTRHLDHPVSVVVRGESSAGKSYAIKQALQFGPPESSYTLSAMSPKALFYSDVDLSHRVLVVYEGEGISNDIASYAVRSLLSEGRLDYEFVDFEVKGTQRITKEGPTGLIFSTAGRIDYELSTRMISISIGDSPQITGEILKLEAMAATRPLEDIDPSRFHAYDRLIGREVRPVVIPFAPQLAELTDRQAVRMRRDFGAVLGLIKGHALLHFRHRAVNENGALVARVADYRAVHALVADLLADASGRSVPVEVRETVEAVTELNAIGTVTIQGVAEKLDRDRSTASRRLNRAIGMGFVNDVSERSKRKVFQPGEPLPDDAGVLPDPTLLSGE